MALKKRYLLCLSKILHSLLGVPALIWRNIMGLLKSLPWLVTQIWNSCSFSSFIIEPQLSNCWLFFTSWLAQHLGPTLFSGCQKLLKAHVVYTSPSYVWCSVFQITKLWLQGPTWGEVVVCTLSCSHIDLGDLALSLLHPIPVLQFLQLVILPRVPFTRGPLPQVGCCLDAWGALTSLLTSQWCLPRGQPPQFHIPLQFFFALIT